MQDMKNSNFMHKHKFICP